MYDKRAILTKIKDIYDDGGNIIQYLRKSSGEQRNTIEDIMISYDFQASTYMKSMVENDANGVVTRNAARHFMKAVNQLPIQAHSIMEAGTGECSFLGEILPYFDARDVYGFDISWSRIKYRRKYLEENVKMGGKPLCRRYVYHPDG